MNMEAPKAANDNEKSKVWTQSEAIAQLGVWRQEVAGTHRFDSEPKFLSDGIIRVINGEDPSAVIAEAHAMMSKRQEGLTGSDDS